MFDLPSSPALPAWKCTGILKDLVAPLQARVMDGVVVEGARVTWAYPVGGDAAAITAAKKHPVIKSGRFNDTDTDWAEALLAEHLSADDMFLHALSGTPTTVTVAPSLKIGSQFPFWRADRENIAVTIRIQWTTPRRVELTRPINYLSGVSGGGKAMAMAAFVASAQARGQQVTIIDPKGGWKR